MIENLIERLATSKTSMGPAASDDAHSTEAIEAAFRSVVNLPEVRAIIDGSLGPVVFGRLAIASGFKRRSSLTEAELPTAEQVAIADALTDAAAKTSLLLAIELAKTDRPEMVAKRVSRLVETGLAESCDYVFAVDRSPAWREAFVESLWEQLASVVGIGIVVIDNALGLKDPTTLASAFVARDMVRASLRTVRAWVNAGGLDATGVAAGGE